MSALAQTAVTLTSAEVNALGSGNFILIPSPGLNKVIWVEDVILGYEAGSIPFTVSDSSIIVSVGARGGNIGQVLQTENSINPIGFLDQTQSLLAGLGGFSIFQSAGVIGSITPTVLSAVANLPLNITCNGPISSGNGKLAVTILYTVKTS